MRKSKDIFGEKRREKIIIKLTLKYGFRCWYCGYNFKSNSEICIDHISPLSFSHDSNISNLALSCKFCNNAKYSFPIENFLRYLARIRTSQFNCLILETYKDNLDNLTKDSLSKSFY